MLSQFIVNSKFKTHELWYNPKIAKTELYESVQKRSKIQNQKTFVDVLSFKCNGFFVSNKRSN